MCDKWAAEWAGSGRAMGQLCLLHNDSIYTSMTLALTEKNPEFHEIQPVPNDTNWTSVRSGVMPLWKFCMELRQTKKKKTHFLYFSDLDLWANK